VYLFRIPVAAVPALVRTVARMAGVDCRWRESKAAGSVAGSPVPNLVVLIAAVPMGLLAELAEPAEEVVPRLGLHLHPQTLWELAAEMPRECSACPMLVCSEVDLAGREQPVPRGLVKLPGWHPMKVDFPFLGHPRDWPVAVAEGNSLTPVHSRDWPVAVVEQSLVHPKSWLVAVVVGNPVTPVHPRDWRAAAGNRLNLVLPKAWLIAVVDQSPVLVLVPVPGPVFPILAVADQLDPRDYYRLALPSLEDSMSSWFLVVAVAANLPNRRLKQQFHPSWISHCCGRAEMLRSGQQLLIPGQQR